MRQKYWFWFLILIILGAAAFYFYNNPPGGPRSPGITALTIERTDGFPDWKLFPANMTNTELFGFTFNNSTSTPGTTSTTDVLITSIDFQIFTTSSPSIASTSIRNIRLVSDGVVLGSMQRFTTTFFTFNIQLAMPKNSLKSLHLLADTQSSSVWGDLQFKIFDVTAADSVTGARIPVLRLPDEAWLSWLFPLESTHFYF